MDIKNKKGWVAQDYVIALILFSAIVGLLYLGVGSIATDYNTPGIVDPSFKENYDEFNNQTATIGAMWNATSSKGSLNLFSGTDIFLKSTFSVVSLIFGSIGSLTRQVTHIQTDFGVPDVIWGVVSIIFMATITILLIFAVVNALNKAGPL